MDTSKYAPAERRQLKKWQRTSAYREMQRHAAEQRAELEKKLAERGKTIERLRAKLKELGVTAEQVDQLAPAA